MSGAFDTNRDMKVETVKTNFIHLSKMKSFCKNWIEKFVS